MTNISSTDQGALARRLREDAGLGVRALAAELEVTFSAVARAERGDSALVSLAERAAAYLLSGRSHARGVSDVVREEEIPYGGLDESARGRISRLLAVERGWRRALVRGVLEEHGFEVKTEESAAIASTPDDELRIDLDRFVVRTGTATLQAFDVSPFDRADREGWGRALEQLAVAYGRGDVGWAKQDEELDILTWAIDADESP